MKEISFLTLFIVITTTVQAQLKSVIQSSWPQTSLLAETSEFLAEKDKKKFWSFVKQTSSLESFLNDKQHYDFIKSKEVIDVLGSEFMSNVLDFSLGIREFSPSVEVQTQLGRKALKDSNTISEGCNSFVSLEVVNENKDSDDSSAHKTFCTLADLNVFYKKVKEKKINLKEQAIDNEDHRWSSKSQTSGVFAVIYGRFDDSVLHDFINFYQESGLDFVFRHYSSREDKLRLSGYGIELAIKNMEYKAVDDRSVKEKGPHIVDDDIQWDEDEEVAGDTNGFLIAKLKELHPGNDEKFNSLKAHFLQVDEITPLKEWQTQDLGMQAAAHIFAQPKSFLHSLRDVSSNLQIKAKSLTKIKVEPLLVDEVKRNAMHIKAVFDMDEEKDFVFVVNGKRFDTLDPFKISHTIRTEADVFEHLAKEKLNKETSLKLLSTKDPFSTSSSSDGNEQRFDIRHKNIMFLNNLEKDHIYNGWHQTLDALRHGLGQGLAQVAKNIVTVVFVLDPLYKDMSQLTNLLVKFKNMKAPLRIAFLFGTSKSEDIVSISKYGDNEKEVYEIVSDKKDSSGDFQAKLVRICHFIAKKVNTESVLRFLRQIQNKGNNLDDNGLFNIVKKHKSIKEDEFKKIISKTGSYEEKRLSTDQFIAERGVRLNSIYSNGLYREIASEGLDAILFHLIRADQMAIMQAVMQRKINDNTNIYDYFMNQPETVKSGGNQLTEQSAYFQLTSPFFKDFKYVNGEACSSSVCTTVFVRADLSTIPGMRTLYEFLSYMKSAADSSIRFGFIPSVEREYEQVSLDKVAVSVFQNGNEELLDVFALFLKDLLTEKIVGNDVNIEIKIKEFLDENSKIKEVYEVDCKEFMSTGPKITDTIVGKNTIFLQGKVIVDDEVGFGFGDFSMLIDRVETFVYEITDILPEKSRTSEYLVSICSVLGGKLGERKSFPSTLKYDNSGIKIKGSDDLIIQVAVDPLSKAAQKIAPMLLAFVAAFNPTIHIALLPIEKLPELPLSRFYRYAIEGSPRFNKDGRILGPAPAFKHLPRKPLLTLSLDVPRSWDVSAVESIYDLDNIHMESVKEREVKAVFELKYLLVEGHCYEHNGQPARGLQLLLESEVQNTVHDTLVMANLGYFQLKASAGVWNLKLRPGRSKDIYEFDDTEIQSIPIVLRSFEGIVKELKVKKKTGKEHMTLENAGGEEQEESPSYWDSMKSMVGVGGKKREGEIINVFSIASGHLYERFMSIMILSVLKNTNNPVKFWLFGDSMSPKFRKFLPHFAREHGFDFDFVTYKWPEWLRAQTEKQRIVWGYKILFLDVLFPLNVKRVIFVDADQIVRADLNELMEMDLKGAPYGYTPFCSDRKEMDRFRFWLTGYWKSHLNGKPYHISALYVIDLVRFRQLAAGDRLRGSYHQLSADPNSLANLDQDLPNNMQPQLEMFSLPQEWLWCETWCSDESKGKAKTIDLCNNPLTKEPKLKAATRIVPEWTDLDNEVTAMVDKISKLEKKQKQEQQSDEKKPKDDKHDEL